jgi:hypothetical protein
VGLVRAAAAVIAHVLLAGQALASHDRSAAGMAGRHASQQLRRFALGFRSRDG